MVNLHDVAPILRRCIRTGTNLTLTGEPGIGKTSIINQVVEAIQKTDSGFKLWDIYTPSLSPIDFSVPMPNQSTGKLDMYHNTMMPNAFDDPDQRGVLFLGERDNADPATNKALQKYINNEAMSGLMKPKGVIVVADSNHINHRSGTVQQSLALLSRSRLIHVEVDADVTLKYFAQIELNPFVQAYLSLRKEHVSTFETLLKNKGYEIWANPRGWERLGRAMDDADANGEILSQEEIIGDIGEAVGREFIAFLHAAKELVSYEQIASDPKTAPRPDKLSDVYAVMAMLSATTQAEDFPNVRTYVERWGAEVQVLYLRLLVTSKGKHKTACVSTRAYTEWFSQPELMSALT
ncbi:MAG: ATP-binding protein [Bellilinea sp.]